jgi:hypothetical protein
VTIKGSNREARRTSRRKRGKIQQFAVAVRGKETFTTLGSRLREVMFLAELVTACESGSILRPYGSHPPSCIHIEAV